MKMFTRVLSLVLIALTLCALLAACAPAKDPADAKAALEKAGYVATKTDGTLLALVGIKDCTDVVSGTKKEGDKVEGVSIYYFETAEAAETAFEKIEDLVEEFKDEDDASDFVFKMSGKIVYGGTKAAVKAAR